MRYGYAHSVCTARQVGADAARGPTAPSALHAFRAVVEPYVDAGLVSVVALRTPTTVTHQPEPPSTKGFTQAGSHTESQGFVEERSIDNFRRLAAFFRECKAAATAHGAEYVAAIHVVRYQLPMRVS